jgi:hypothetical protein
MLGLIEKLSADLYVVKKMRILKGGKNVLKGWDWKKSLLDFHSPGEEG